MQPTIKQILLIVVAMLVYLTVMLTAATAQDTQMISPSKDNTLVENLMGSLSNGAGQRFFVGRTNQGTDNIRRGVIAFDIAKSIPKGSKITEVNLTLTLERTPGGKQSIKLHRLLQNWGEGKSSHQGGKGGKATSGEVTWIYTFYDTQSWSNQGGYFSDIVSGIQVVDDVGVYVWKSTPKMVADVQDWLDFPQSNFGWLLLGNEITPGTVKGFASRESKEHLAQPKLMVMYVKPSSIL
ncbi:DNRLRE domain-containing protein [Aphanothece sacrum]|uniref:CHRD domain-containing protein n=1 Tax=Aphanothece sacrum FPU1 TaxID=1920663 RepID=A0A401IHE3_APHSA|nr:DNRLRE domain-containing protein [Aphanothece sacrum]GBF80626.1 CHRD domain-containing protein [Aphanothece sacrum FPU1]GBF83984.1 hypothetical protein AsFPU3_1028 [Aphanothece sacrum FPU3]